MRKLLLLLIAVLFIFNVALASAFNILNERAVEAHIKDDRYEEKITWELVGANTTEVTFNVTTLFLNTDGTSNSRAWGQKVGDCIIRSEEGCDLEIKDISFTRGNGESVRALVFLGKIDRQTGESLVNVTLSTDLPPMPPIAQYRLMYRFEEDTPEVFKRAEQYFGRMYPCPEQVSYEAIENELEKLGKVYLTPREISEQVANCEESHFEFNVRGKPTTPATDECRAHALALLDMYGLNDGEFSNSSIGIIMECESRALFSERYNEATIPDYNPSLMRQLLAERDEVFVLKTSAEMERKAWYGERDRLVFEEDKKRGLLPPDAVYGTTVIYGNKTFPENNETAETPSDKPKSPDSPPGKSIAPPEDKPPAEAPGHAEEKPGQTAPGRDKQDDSGTDTPGGQEEPAPGAGGSTSPLKKENPVKAIINKVVGGFLKWLSAFA